MFESLHLILKMGGKLTLAYPEFEKCALNFVNNKGVKVELVDTDFLRYADRPRPVPCSTHSK